MTERMRRHPPHRLAGLGEDAEVLGLDEVGDLDGRERDRAALRARLGAERRDALEPVLLGRLDDAGHGLDRDDGVLAHARLAREHHRVGAVEDGVGDVGGLGARRHRAVDHRLEHLRGHDHRLRQAAGELDRALLHDRHRLERQLDAEVAARDHDRVERLDDLLERVDGLRLLDLGDDRHATADLRHDLVHAVDVGGVAHERERDEVGAELEAPAQVGLVLLGQRGHVHRDARAG